MSSAPGSHALVMSSSLSTGTHLGRYEIRSRIGAGGMGEVYRAFDPKINREVAIKILPPALSADKDRLARFEQEAQAAGALNHPNILVIHHIDTHDGAPYIVSELLEGETLRERMGGVALPQRKAIDCALQTAHGLAAAHEKGIVHRDLKPENLFVTKDGRVKILDFGLAKLTGEGDATQPQTEVPTRRVNTDPGMVMGTIGYMSPEQLRGKGMDHRSDIFSFGAILYEMLSGRRAFRGESAADTMSAILKEDPPDLSETTQNIAPALERLVNHCLEKNPEERFHSASDLAFALEALSGSAPVSAQTMTAISASPVSARLVKHLPWIVAGTLGLALLITIALLISSFKQTPTRTNVIRAAILPPEGANYLPRNQFAISPDGLRLAFVGRSGDGKQLLWVRSLGASTAQALAGTDDATYPFWSPDSRFVGFFAQTKLKKIDASGGPPQTICDAPNGRGGTWNRDGVIVLAPDNFSPLYRVSASGGPTTVVTRLDDSKLQATHRWPWFLPDSRHFLYRAGTTSASTQKESNGIYLGSLDSLEQRLIVRTDTSPVYEGGYLLFIRDGTLMAQPFDEKTFQTTGDALPVAEHVQFDFGVGYLSLTFHQMDSASRRASLIFKLEVRTSGSTNCRATCRRDSHSIRTSTQIRFGRQTGVESSGVRIERVTMTFTKRLPPAPAATKFFSSQKRTRVPPHGLPMGASLRTPARILRGTPSTIFGSCPCSAIANLFPFLGRSSTKSMRSFRPTAAGSLMFRTSQGAIKSMSPLSRVLEVNGRSRETAARNRAGEVMAKRSSSCPLTTS